VYFYLANVPVLWFLVLSFLAQCLFGPQTGVGVPPRLQPSSPSASSLLMLSLTFLTTTLPHLLSFFVSLAHIIPIYSFPDTGIVYP